VQSAHGIVQAAAPWQPPQPLFLLGILDFELPLSRAPYVHDKCCDPTATPRVVKDGPRKVFISWHEVLQSLLAIKIISQILRMWLNGLLGWFLPTANELNRKKLLYHLNRFLGEGINSCTVDSGFSGPTKIGKFRNIHNPPRLPYRPLLLSDVLIITQNVGDNKTSLKKWMKKFSGSHSSSTHFFRVIQTWVTIKWEMIQLKNRK